MSYTSYHTAHLQSARRLKQDAEPTAKLARLLTKHVNLMVALRGNSGDPLGT